MSFRNLSIFLVALTSLTFSNMAFAVISSTSSEFFDSTTEGTSSTTNSTKKLFSQADKDRLEMFVDRNFDRLQEEAARGNGVILTDYVSLVGCQNSNAVMSTAMQKNYRHLFNGGKSKLVEQTEQLINSSSELTLACGTNS